MQVSCQFHYDAAHWLPHVPQGHKCGRLHGHTYQLTVVVDGPVRDNGFVMDFADIKSQVEPLIKQLDHHCLNDIAGLTNPTVEVQLEWLWSNLGLVGLSELRLREGLGNEASYRPS